MNNQSRENWPKLIWILKIKKTIQEEPFSSFWAILEILFWFQQNLWSSWWWWGDEVSAPQVCIGLNGNFWVAIFFALFCHPSRDSTQNNTSIFYMHISCFHLVGIFWIVLSEFVENLKFLSIFIVLSFVYDEATRDSLNRTIFLYFSFLSAACF